MANCRSVYKPGEDSTMLEAYARQYAKGNVLDIGTGSGIQAIAAAQSEKVSSVLAVDIQKSVIDYCKKCIKNRKITFMVSDLFEIFKKNKKLKNKKFDTIIFNPPYLPQELKLKDLTLEGGKKGYEAIERFLNEANDFLKANGIILIVFSSLTKKEKVDEFIRNNLLESELLEKQHIFFEDLYAYKIVKLEILKKLESKKIKSIHYFAKGKRGLVFTGEYKSKKIAVKIKNQKSEATGRIENEANFLRILNKKGIGPKILLGGEGFLAYEFVEGVNILEFFASLKNFKEIFGVPKNSKNFSSTLKNNAINKKNNDKNNKKIILSLIRRIMSQMFVMDKLRINKQEMSHPQKHILVKNGREPVLIDFERCRYTINPSNVTQFCDFLISNSALAILKNSNILINKNKIINAAKQYKKQQNQNNFNKIIRLIK